MGRHFRRLLVLAFVLTAGLVVLRNTVYWSIWQLNAALVEGDVQRAESLADLSSLAGGFVDLATLATEQDVRRSSGDVAAALVGAFVAAFANPAKELFGPAGAQQLRDAIAKKELAHRMGAFRYEGFAALGTVESGEKGDWVEVRGNCDGEDASVRIFFEKVQGPLFGFPRNHRAKRFDRESLRGLAAACLRASEKRQGGK